MGCSFSGLNALYDAVNGGGDVWINQNRFRIVKQLGEGGFAFVYLVKEVVRDGASGGGGLSGKLLKNPTHVSDDGTYALKKVLVQSEEQLALVKEEIHVSSLFSHANLLPLIDHAIIAVKDSLEGTWKHEAYLLFPVHLDGTLLDNVKSMQSRKEFFSALTVLQIFRQICAGLKHMHSFDPPYAHNDVKPGNVLITHKKGQPPLAVVMDFGSARPAKLKIRSRSEALQLQICAGLKHMHSFDPPYAHNDVKPGNVLITHKKGQPPLAVLMDFGSARPAKLKIRSRSEALQLQEWAAEHCSAPFRAPELWDCPSHVDIDSRTDIWALGCTLYAIMYGISPFEYALDSGGSLQLAIMNAQIKWPSCPNKPFPESLHQFVSWMLQPQLSIRPYIDDIILHVDKLILNLS